jgi:site-specific recombinase XerC
VSPRGTRQTIAPGIYQDDLGYEVRARAGGRTTSKRFPSSAKLSKMKAWQDDERKRLRKATRDRQTLIGKGTLAADVATHLATLPDRQRRLTLAMYTAWLTPDLAKRPRASITIDQLRTLVSSWADAGVAASTINHRRRALVALYEALDGDDEPVLPRRLKRQPEPAAVPRAVSMDLLDEVITRMTDYPYHGDPRKRNRAKARLRLMLWTGITPSTMSKLTAHSIDLVAREIHLPARGKGRGAPAVTLPLWEPQGVDAARAWLRAFAWGPASAHRLSDALHRALKAYGAARAAAGRPGAVPPGIRLHDLRHSFLTMVARTRRDPRIVQWYGQHADLKTSQRYILAAMPDLVREAARATLRATETPGHSRIVEDMHGHDVARKTR